MKKNKIKWCVLLLVAVCGVAALVISRKTQPGITIFKTTGQRADGTGNAEGTESAGDAGGAGNTGGAGSTAGAENAGSAAGTGNSGGAGNAGSAGGVGNTGGTAGGSDAGQDAANPAGEASGRETVIYVHVCGAVAKEGVYTLPEGSRVTDAVTAAGGFSPEADSTYYNLAKRLADGQKVYIPTKEETKGMGLSERTEGDPEELSGGAQAGTKEKKINLNTAGKEELMTLPGIGETKADGILSYRKKVGAFRTVEEIKNVSGIGDALFEQIKELISTE